MPHGQRLQPEALRRASVMEPPAGPLAGLPPLGTLGRPCPLGAGLLVLLPGLAALPGLPMLLPGLPVLVPPAAAVAPGSGPELQHYDGTRHPASACGTVVVKEEPLLLEAHQHPHQQLHQQLPPSHPPRFQAMGLPSPMLSVFDKEEMMLQHDYQQHLPLNDPAFAAAALASPAVPSPAYCCVNQVDAAHWQGQVTVTAQERTGLPPELRARFGLYTKHYDSAEAAARAVDG